MTSALVQENSTRGDRPFTWVLLPRGEDDVGTWVEATAKALETESGEEGDEGAHRGLVARLAESAQLGILSGYPAGLLFVPDPRIDAPHVRFALAAVPALHADAAADQRELLGLDDLGDFSGQVDDLRVHGIDGYQLFRVDKVQEAPDSEVLIATLITAIRREVPGLGLRDLVVAGVSSEVVLTAGAVVPVVDLLLGDDLMKLLGG